MLLRRVPYHLLSLLNKRGPMPISTSIYSFHPPVTSESVQTPLRLNNEAREFYRRASAKICAIEERVSRMEKKRDTLASTSPTDARIMRYSAMIEKRKSVLTELHDMLRQLEINISTIETLALIRSF